MECVLPCLSSTPTYLGGLGYNRITRTPPCKTNSVSSSAPSLFTTTTKTLHRLMHVHTLVWSRCYLVASLRPLSPLRSASTTNLVSSKIFSLALNKIADAITAFSNCGATPRYKPVSPSCE